jgi:hypothetical protein
MSLLEDSPANHSVLQENKKELTTTVISGQKCLDSLKKLNQSSLLGRMCKALLTSKTAWYSDRCKTNWKVKVSKSNVSLFQLQASVLGTKETESGLWATPNTMDYLPPRSAAGTKKLMEGHRKGRTKPSNLREQVDPETMKMYPTPRTGGGSRPNGKGGKVLEEEVMIEYGLRERGKTLKQMEEHKRMYPTPTTQEVEHPNMVLNEKGRRLTKDGKDSHSLNLADTMRMYPTPKASGQENAETLIKRKGAKAAAQHNLTANVQMYPTPSASCEMDVVAPPETVEKNSSGWSVRRVGTGTKFGAKLNDVVNKVSQPIEPGGKLNPTFVEFLMGFPESWTKIDPTE